MRYTHRVSVQACLIVLWDIHTFSSVLFYEMCTYRVSVQLCLVLFSMQDAQDRSACLEAGHHGTVYKRWEIISSHFITGAVLPGVCFCVVFGGCLCVWYPVVCVCGIKQFVCIVSSSLCSIQRMFGCVWYPAVVCACSIKMMFMWLISRCCVVSSQYVCCST